MAFIQLRAEFIVCKNVMDCPFVQMNYPVEILLLRITYWGHYGTHRQPPTLCKGWQYWCGGPHGLPTHCPPSWSSLEGVTLTVHSWQSVSSPPTTMRYLRCGEQGLCRLQLKPSSSRRTCRLWSFFFQRAQMLTLLYAWETLQPSLPRKKENVKSCPLVTDPEWFKLKNKCLNGIQIGNIVDWLNKNHLLSMLSRVGCMKCGVETSIRTSY